MYSTCLFCHHSLGTNESIENFPIGRRLAFDGAKGRLWVICDHCFRWNLTPLEERWEAIEECERLFRSERLRIQTDQIGLTKLREGLQLVRIGEPLRPEFAAWRYGNVFRARFRRTAAWLGGAAATFSAGAGIGLATGALQTVGGLLFVAPVACGAILLSKSALVYREYFRTIHVPREQGPPYTVFRTHIRETDLGSGDKDGEWVLNLQHSLGVDQLRGPAARRGLSILLAKVNEVGAVTSTTRSAAERISNAGGPETYLAKLAAASQQLALGYREKRARFRRGGFEDSWALEREPPRNRGALRSLSAETRLALEMAVHEEDERRALEEEIGPLEAAWRDAEEIASIADDLLTTPAARGFIRRNRPKR